MFRKISSFFILSFWLLSAPASAAFGEWYSKRSGDRKHFEEHASIHLKNFLSHNNDKISIHCNTSTVQYKIIFSNIDKNTMSKNTEGYVIIGTVFKEKISFTGHINTFGDLEINRPYSVEMLSKLRRSDQLQLKLKSLPKQVFYYPQPKENLDWLVSNCPLD